MCITMQLFRHDAHSQHVGHYAHPHQVTLENKIVEVDIWNIEPFLPFTVISIKKTMPLLLSYLLSTANKKSV